MSETQPQTDTDDATDEQPAEQTTDSPDLTTEAGGFACAAEAHVFQDYFGTFQSVLDELRLHINPEGFSGLGVGPAQVGFTGDDLSKEAFEHYSSTGGVIGFDLSRMENVLSFADAGALVRMELDQETRKLHLDVDGLEYTLALIDPESIRAEPEIPDLDLPGEVTLEGKRLAQAVKAADLVSDHVRFRIGETDEGEDAFFVEAVGDTDEVVLTLTEDELLDLQIGDADSLFSLDYVEDFADVIPNDAAVTLRLGEEFPVKIEYEHIEVDGETHAEATQMLAPRIQSD